VTVFLGGGFAAKYLHGGGNFSVPLQWMLGLRRLNLDAIWLEHLPSEGNPRDDKRKIENFRRQLRAHGLSGRYCLLYHKKPTSEHDLDALECIGLSKRELLDRLAGPNTLLNLSYSLHPPLLLKFERRIFCDLDPSEIIYWMTRMEMGQSTHHEFWTIGLNVNDPDCKLLRMAPSKLPGVPLSSLPPNKIKWKTFYPLVDTKLYRPQPRPRSSKFTTIGQWYWGGAVEVDGDFPDLSKKYAFEKYLDLPRRLPQARFELAMHMSPDDPDRERLRKRGWRVVDPHRVAMTPKKYRQYVASALAEFTVIKGVDVSWKTGWLSDRAAAFLATGRPVITEDSGAGNYLPRESGFHFINDLENAAAALENVVLNWRRHSREARRCAVELFDSGKNLRKILDL
jgi:glycosyltransferase involved in cell wall biosynthesis